MTETEPPDTVKFINSVYQLLNENPRRYRNFGVYWFFVKALLKRQYTQDQLYLLGDYTDPEISAHMPAASAADTLSAAIETYRYNAMNNMGRAEVLAPDDEYVIIYDQDAGF